MRTDYESHQTVEVCGPDDTYNETEITIGLYCSTPSTPAQLYGPPERCYPAEGAEFELTTISLSLASVNPQADPLVLTYEQAQVVFGTEVIDKLIENAMQEADETGDF